MDIYGYVFETLENRFNLIKTFLFVIILSSFLGRYLHSGLFKITTAYLKFDVIQVHQLLQNGWRNIRVLCDRSSQCWGGGFPDNFHVMYYILQKCTAQWLRDTEAHLLP